MLRRSQTIVFTTISKMEVYREYFPRPYLWTGLIREFAEDINNLDVSRSCSRQQAVLNKLYNMDASCCNGFWVRAKHILPSGINLKIINTRTTTMSLMKQ